MEQSQTRHVTLRFSILFIFIALFVIAMVMMIGFTYSRFSSQISNVAFKFLNQVSTTTIREIETEIHSVALVNEFTAAMVQTGVINPQELTEPATYIFTLMSLAKTGLPSVQSAYWADANGTFIDSEVTADGSITSEIIDRKKSAFTHQFFYRDLQGNPIKTVNSTDFTYDPRNQPWFQIAKNNKNTSWLAVYPFRVTHYLGITAATPVFNADALVGIFALNIRIDFLRRYLENKQISEHGIIYIIDSQGKVVAFPHLVQYNRPRLIPIQGIENPWLQKSFQIYKENKQAQFIFQYDHHQYLAIYRPISEFTGLGWVIGIVVPENDFVNELNKTNLISLAIGLLILIFGIFIMSKLSRRIVKPLLALTAETEKIKNFELEGEKRISSRIKEVILLSNGIYAMKVGLRSFKKYVPANLVRKLIETGQDVVIEGERKSLAIFFSDIKNFSTFSEKTDPVELMQYMYQYFDILSHAIIAHHGTLDKYIGDSIMAFWGAPTEEPQPCHQAARAALACQQLIKEKDLLYTRIGLHYGEVIVGNVGSSERFNYTAIGNNINLTKRLEGVNKTYASKIMVSAVVYELIKDQFLLRFVDLVKVKGITQPIYTYELLAEKGSILSFDLNAYRDQFEKAFAAYQQRQWQQAIAYFESCLHIYPSDNLAPVFIKRCSELSVYPPDKNWAGDWQIAED